MANLSQAALHALAEKSGVSFHVLVKIRLGYTPNPGIETVRKFYSLVSAVANQYPNDPPKDAA